jgi:nicotinate phosphoribosyltransferase
VDLLALEDELFSDTNAIVLHHPTEYGVSRVLRHAEISKMEPLLKDVIKKEGFTAPGSPSIAAMRALREEDMQRLDTGVKRLMNPHVYHVSLSERLWNLKKEMIKKISRKPE